ncbi:hypothetical protein VitviT2T_017097 [Vitis vinifera]|uniref:Uncharacterized protein n=1 Tax=Vitis vinifera TaxID=29760 RepID=A0ABY9CTR9_VITVI|nr:hypothetical protein VitviT2T_017097 [Vitis vinifera]
MERKNRAIPKDSGLTQRLFSWSLEDIYNEDLYKTQLVLCLIMVLQLSPLCLSLGLSYTGPSQFICSSVEAFLRFCSICMVQSSLFSFTC